MAYIVDKADLALISDNHLLAGINLNNKLASY